MDTNLKRTHKSATFLIALIILGAALMVTCLYPRTGAAMDKLRNKYQEEYAQDNHGQAQYCVEGAVVNYAMEASYYMFGFLLQQCENRAVDFSVLDEYGWDSDYHVVMDACDYLAVYQDTLGVPEISMPLELEADIVTDTEAIVKSEEYIEQTSTAAPIEAFKEREENNSVLEEQEEECRIQEVVFSGSNTDLWPLLENASLSKNQLQEMYDAGILAYLVLEFDAYGKLTIADMKFTSENVRYYQNSVYKIAKKSIEQYRSNIKGYVNETGGNGDYYQVMPKNFKAVFTIREDGGFVFQENSGYHYMFSSEHLYWETGVAFVILAIALWVAFAALMLPFIKILNTGWERLFCIHIETVLCLCVLGGFAAYGMMQAMTYTNMYEIQGAIGMNGSLEFLGYTITPVVIYYGLLGLNFLGWAGCFLIEYIVVAAFRQFLSRPGYYLTHRFLIVNILKWMLHPIKRLYEYVTDIDITHKLKNSILKIVIANFVLVSLLCCLWFFGISGLILYSVVLYILLKKYGSRLQKQYTCIIEATEKMADGDLKVMFEEDLGIFTPIGQALGRIQQGFREAVTREAQSQNMKTELITNVSHDLKTPLTAIITYLNLLKNPDISEEERQGYIDTLDQKTQRLKILIEDLFEVSKAQSGNIKMNFMELDVVSLIKQVRLEMEDQIMSSDLSFRWNLPDEKVLLNLDGQKTYRVFVNLIHNILKYSMPGSRVFIDLALKNDTVQIGFRNISMAELDFDVERLTDRFVRGDASRNTEGSGLGLAIAKSFVELQHGTFRIDVDGDLFKVTISWPLKG